MPDILFVMAGLFLFAVLCWGLGYAIGWIGGHKKGIEEGTKKHLYRVVELKRTRGKK